MNNSSSLFIGAVLLFGIASCSQSDERSALSDLPGLALAESPKDAATLLKEREELKDLALSNQMIALTGADFKEMQEKILKSKKEEIEADKLLQAKAIVYRFYKTVYVKDGALYSRAKSGEEIGIREDAFKFYCENLQDMSRGIKEIRKTEEYTDEQIENQLKKMNLADMIR